MALLSPDFQFKIALLPWIWAKVKTGFAGFGKLTPFIGATSNELSKWSFPTAITL